jgi:N-acetylglucosamine kinase-like BadF-type ATPase
MFLGVDGGGTKTALCLINQSGQLLASVQAPSSDYFSEGINLVERVLQQGVSAVCAKGGISPQDIQYAFFGLPSYGEASKDTSLLDAIPRAVLGHNRYACDNDMVCAWAGSLAGADGINVISGTGSLAYGERAGRSARVGGWSELFGDEGSGYWIAVRGLAAFSKMSDGRLPHGPLLQVLREHLELKTDYDLVDVILNRWQRGRSNIAALSRVVVKAAGLGDDCARQILTNAARELAELVDVTRWRLGFGHAEAVPVSYSGGIFTVAAVLAAFREEIAGLDAGYELRRPMYQPVVGAALYAAKLAGTPLTDAALAHLARLSAPHKDVRASGASCIPTSQ